MCLVLLPLLFIPEASAFLLCSNCVLFLSSDMTLPSFSSQSLSLVSPSQLIVSVLASWGSLLSTLQGSCLVPPNGRAGHVPTDRQYRNLFVGGGHVEDKSTMVNPPYPITCPTVPHFSGLIGLFTRREKCASDVIFLGYAFMLILEKPLSFISGKR